MSTRLTGAGLALTLGVLLSACSGSTADSGTGTGKGDIASLASGAPQATTSSTATNERPLIRTDTSPEEEQRMWDAWQDCIEKNGGAPSNGAAGKGPRPATDPDRQDPKAMKAVEACANMEPETVWGRAKRLDPAYPDKLRDWVTCVRSHGIDAWESNGLLTFESLPPDNQMKKVDECQDKAFGTG
jgi:hypothetical protein